MDPNYLLTVEGYAKYRILRSMFREVGVQRIWIDELTNWLLGAAGVYAGLLIANLDKLTPALKPGGPAATAIPLLLSMLVGGAIKIISGYAGFVLSVEGGIPEAVQPILVEETNRQLNERGIQQNQPQYGQEAPITSKAIMSPLVLEFVQTQPRFVRWAAEMGMRHVDKDILVGIKLPARIYFWMLLGLAIQSFTLTFAIVLPLLLIR